MLKTAKKKTNHESTKFGKHEKIQLGLSNPLLLSCFRTFVFSWLLLVLCCFLFFSILHYSSTPSLLLLCCDTCPLALGDNLDLLEPQEPERFHHLLRLFLQKAGEDHCSILFEEALEIR